MLAAALAAGVLTVRMPLAGAHEVAPPTLKEARSTQPVQPNIDSAGPPENGMSVPSDRCLSVAEVGDRDGDYSRNAATLSSPDLCLTRANFAEGRLVWTLQIVRNKASPHDYLWLVPHDNENVAFDTAVFAVAHYGGTIVAVETGGSRFNGPQDPNRNFDAGTGRKCPQQIARSPVYTATILKWRSGNAPVIALHSNDRGYGGDGHGGAGGISILRPLPGNTSYRSANPMPTRSPNDSVVFVASEAGSGGERSPVIAALNNAGLNVVRETVSASSNDCSFSNFAVLSGIRSYLNIEVVHGDGAGQRRMLAAALPLLSGAGRKNKVAVPEISDGAIVTPGPPPRRRRQVLPATSTTAQTARRNGRKTRFTPAFVPTKKPASIARLAKKSTPHRPHDSR